jgi:predicted anti-sigma-YlaC factor YlaD
MNCPDCLDFLQRRLDGSQEAVPAALDVHLARCGDCRAWFAAAQRLQEGLRCQAAPSAPAYLTDAIVSAIVIRQRLRRLRRWLVAGAAVAAGVCIAFLTGYRSGHHQGPAPSPQALQNRPGQLEKHLTTPESPSLRRGVDAARSAMVALTDDVKSTTRRLLGSATAPFQGKSFTHLPAVEELEQPLEPAAQSLRNSGRGVAVSLAAVTGSARRAVDYFTHEFSSLPGGKKTGL